MNEFKFQITTFLLVALLAFGAYWAFSSLDRGITYQKSDTVASLDEQQQEVEEPVTVIEEETEVPTETEEPVEETPEPEPEVSEDRQDLLRRLENLIEDEIFMKDGSRGTRVGTVQEFLNLYLDEQSSVDNQYGPGTLRRVREFQEAEGLSADGLAGPATYQAMIDVLPSL
jgi:peptidoglycan hydrolase-like protein with peptidoglycan-binding domain